MPADRSSTLYKDKGARKGAFVMVEYNFVMVTEFHIGVKGIVFVGNKCLVLKNKNKHWDVPGGRIDDDE